MPIYEYKCRDCGHRFEELVMGGREPMECPKCHKHRVERQMSLFSSCAPGGGAPLSSGHSCGSGGFS